MSSPPRKTFSLKWLIIIILATLTIWAILTPDINSQLQEMMSSIRSLGYWGALLFTLVYVAATVILIPGPILTLGAGATFGLWKGFLLVSLASTLAASTAFLVGRHLARDWIWKKIADNSRMAGIKAAIDRDGWKIVGLSRLSPMIPYTILNYFLSLTHVRFTHYVIASWIGMMPGTFAYVYLGSLGAIDTQHEKSAMEWTLLCIGIIATLVVTVLISRIAGKVMARQLRDD
ncbi:MAG: TVP38/TMEM64 family protein [Verrucomicrobiaceae bacterium]|nr:TVP38/TMEM64 family protein [Verrucomicrobiaceae bacterium]